MKALAAGASEAGGEWEREDGRLSFGGQGFAVRWLRRPGAEGRGEAAKAPLVFLHDSLGGVATWRDFPERLAALTGRDAFLYERLGHGGSDPFDRPRNAAYLHREAQEILPGVLDAAGIERGALFGHSDGGSIALLAAALCPGRVTAVVTEGAHIFNEDLTRQGVARAREAYTPDLEARLARHHGDKAAALHRAWTDTWLAPWFHDWNVEALLPGIRCPLLVIQGEDDEFGSLAQVERTVAGAQGRSQGLILPNCGHTPHREAREAVEAAVTAFLSEVD